MFTNSPPSTSFNLQDCAPRSRHLAAPIALGLPHPCFIRRYVTPLVPDFCLPAKRGRMSLNNFASSSSACSPSATMITSRVPLLTSILIHNSSTSTGVRIATNLLHTDCHGHQAVLSEPSNKNVRPSNAVRTLPMTPLLAERKPVYAIGYFSGCSGSAPEMWDKSRTRTYGPRGKSIT